MRHLLRGMLGLDAIVPVVLIVAAVLMTLEPTIFGVAISERQIVLGFFGFLGIDALVERTSRLSRVERRLDALADKMSRRPTAGDLLRARSSFERMDVLVRQARRSVLIIGVNLEGALQCVSALADLACAGGTVRLVAMDPDGDALAGSAAMSGVDPALRRQRSSRIWNSSEPNSPPGSTRSRADGFAGRRRSRVPRRRGRPVRKARTVHPLGGAARHSAKRALGNCGPGRVPLRPGDDERPIPDEHSVIPVFPDDEDGIVEHFYRDWTTLYHTYERGRGEHSHPGFGPHAHSHIKLIAARTDSR